MPERLFIQTAFDNPLFFFSVLFTVVVSIVLHELSHGVAAIRLGDRTPIVRGHMTADPLVHMGPISLVVLVLFGMAWGAMPIDPTRLKGRYAEALVAVAGPVCNLLLSLAALTGLALWFRLGEGSIGTLGGDVPFWENLQTFIWIFGWVNLALCLFNLLPVPPLDGSHIMANLNHSYGRFMHNRPEIGGLAFIGIFLLAPFIFSFAADLAVRYMALIID